MDNQPFIEIPHHFPDEEPEREGRIYSEIIVDAYGDEEIATSWYYYLEEQLLFPFDAMVYTHRKFYPGTNTSSDCSSRVHLLRLASLERCGMHQIWTMGILSVGEEVPLHFFLYDVHAVEPNEQRVQALSDWMYWNRNGRFDLWPHQ